MRLDQPAPTLLAFTRHAAFNAGMTYLCSRPSADSAGSLLFCSLLVVWLGGCSAAPLDRTPPQRFNLSGQWLLLADLSDAGPGARAYDISEPVRVDPSASQRRSRRSRGRFAFIAHDFPVLNARRLEIEQNQDSMGISYDRGGYRDVSWGTRERGLWEVSSGWNDAGELESRWRASDATALENYALSADGDRLTITLNIRAGTDQFEVRRVYSRKDS